MRTGVNRALGHVSQYRLNYTSGKGLRAAWVSGMESQLDDRKFDDVLIRNPRPINLEEASSSTRRQGKERGTQAGPPLAERRSRSRSRPGLRRRPLAERVLHLGSLPPPEWSQPSPDPYRPIDFSTGSPQWPPPMGGRANNHGKPDDLFDLAPQQRQAQQAILDDHDGAAKTRTAEMVQTENEEEENDCRIQVYSDWMEWGRRRYDIGPDEQDLAEQAVAAITEQLLDQGGNAGWVVIVN